jgi:hypothetical protein
MVLPQTLSARTLRTEKVFLKTLRLSTISPSSLVSAACPTLKVLIIGTLPFLRPAISNRIRIDHYGVRQVKSGGGEFGCSAPPQPQERKEMGSGNRWLPKVNYDPERKGSSEPFTFQQNIDGARKDSNPPGQVDAGAAPAAGNPAIPPHQLVASASFSVRHPVMQALLTNLIAAILFSTAWAIVNVVFFPRYTPFMVPLNAINTAHPSLMAAELERASDKTDLLEIAGKSPAQNLAPLWNDLGPDTAGQHYIFGNALRPAAYYFLVPRPAWEHNFAQLAPYTALKLFEIRVSPRLTSKELKNHVNNWAQNCNVEAASIHHWSSWRPRHLKSYWTRAREKYHMLLNKPSQRVDECRPGGACFIIAFDCNAEAFEDFKSVEDDSSDD